MARPRTFDLPTARRAVMDAFWAAGYEATSLAVLMAATSLHKGSLYAAFGDKPSMFRAALAAYEQSEVRGAAEMMRDLPGREAIASFLALPAASVAAGDRRGCFFCNALQETASIDPEAQAMLRTSRDILARAIAEALFRLEPGRLPDAARVDGILAVYIGLRALARGGTDAARLAEIGARAAETA